ncbi:MAG: hypothetical protein AAF415_11510 [Pseudomonadota bacterium]
MFAAFLLDIRGALVLDWLALSAGVAVIGSALILGLGTATTKALEVELQTISAEHSSRFAAVEERIRLARGPYPAASDIHRMEGQGARRISQRH